MSTNWVEIIEPKSKERIYANLETGVCSKFPPSGATVSRTEDYSDHWWELYDTKNGKYYYYNVDRQETVWRKPHGSTDGKEILIIPVTKLQTYRKTVSNDREIERRDASTQTTLNTSTIGTQTVSIMRTSSSAATFQQTNLKVDVPILQRNQCNCSKRGQKYNKIPSQPEQNSFNNLRENCSEKIEQLTTFPIRHMHNGLPASSLGSIDNHHTDLSDPSSLDSFVEKASTSTAHRRNNYRPVVSEYTNTYQHNSSTNPTVTSDSTHNHGRVTYHNRTPASNLSHYLVREARAMGIDLISDDEEADDEDIESDDDYPIDEEDEEDGSGSFQKYDKGHHVSREFDTSSEGCKSVSSDQDVNDSRVAQMKRPVKGIAARVNLAKPGISIENIYDDVYEQKDRIKDSQQNHCVELINRHGKSMLHNKTRSSKTSNLAHQNISTITNSAIESQVNANHFNFDPTIPIEQKTFDDEDRSPTELLSQQLNHYKLVNNFKKKPSNQFGEVVSKLNNLSVQSNEKPSNNISQLKNFSLMSQPSDHHLREVSTLSTLPRPHKFAKDKSALSKQLVQQKSVVHTDSIYDNVEEVCGYHSDSEQTISQQTSASKEAKSSGSKSNIGNNGANPLDSGSFSRSKGSRGSTFSVESFARENLTRHPKKGSLNAMLFNRKVKWSRMITWTRNTIKQSMITSLSTNLNNDAINCFKLVQQFMGDRKVTLSKKIRNALIEAEANKEGVSSRDLGGSIRKSWTKSPPKTSTNNLRRTLSDAGGNIPDLVRDELAQELISIGCSKSPLRDEIYVQVARQVTQNPSQQSIEWGLVLMAIALSYFSPSTKFSPFLFSFLENYDHPMARDVCQPRLEKRIQNSWTTYCRKPATGSEITIVRLSITKWPQYCGVFGDSLDRLMKLQSCSPYLRSVQLPWILTILGEKLLETGGAKTEGIFRCAADCDMIAQLKLEIDCLDFRRITDSNQVKSLFANVVDPHVIAGLLKLFFRELPNPVFPCQLYDVCLNSANDSTTAYQVVMEQLPELNRLVICYLMRLLQELAKEENVLITKMDTSNLSMVWAPNLLRSSASSTLGLNGLGLDASNSLTLDKLKDNTSNNILSQPHSIIFEKARQEMQFIHQLITNLDTSSVANIN